MNFKLYEQTRVYTEFLGQPLSYLIILLGAVLIVSVLIKRFNRYTETLAKYKLIMLAMAFLLLVYFHLQIFRAIKFTDSFTGIQTGIAVPLWIENEKLFFWALLSFIFVYLGPKNPAVFRKTVLVLASLFVILTLVFDTPFSNPLPSFHSEVLALQNATATPDSQEAIGIVKQISARAKYFYNTSYMWLHPPMLFISYAIFAISCIACIFMLRRKDFSFDKIAYDYGKFGYLMLTLGILLGYPWAVMAWKDEPWWWAPKINMSIMTWLFYSAYLHSRIYLSKKGMWHTTAILGVVSFAVLILTYITTYLIPGVHSYG